jgi:hypothetical protein
MQRSEMAFKPYIRANIFCIGMMLLANLEFVLKPLGRAVYVTKALKKVDLGLAARPNA